MDDENAVLEALERDKERMVREYMALQDRADALNEEIYRACCAIEALNRKIAIVQAQGKSRTTRG